MNVFDASAVLALIQKEPGADVVENLLDQGDSLISSVNHAEVIGKLVDGGWSAADIEQVCGELPISVAPLTQSQAVAAGHLRHSTRRFGLSLGGRCCLALAQETPGASVVTSDRAWKGIRPFTYRFIR